MSITNVQVLWDVSGEAPCCGNEHLGSVWCVWLCCLSQPCPSGAPQAVLELGGASTAGMFPGCPTQLQAPASAQGKETELRLRQKGIRSILNFSAPQACLPWRGLLWVGSQLFCEAKPSCHSTSSEGGENNPQVRLFIQEHSAVSLGAHGN